MDFLHTLIAAPISIAVLFILSKIIGNKQMSNLNLFDYINGITIGSIAAELATNEQSKFLNCLTALVIYGLTTVFFTLLSQKNLVLRRFLTGKAIVLYDKGKIFKKNLTTAKLDMNEVLAMLRDKGYFNLDDVQTILLEQSGKMSVLPKENKRPVTPDDLKVRVHQTYPEAVIISDGKIMEKNLKETGNNLSWLEKQLKEQNKKVEEIFMAICDSTNKLKIYNCSDENPTNDMFE